MDVEQQLQQLAEAEKNRKKTELEQLKAQALTEVQRTEAKIQPEYAKQKQTANVQSQLGAKNFAEFLAERGQTRAGLSGQAELSRQNVLGRTLGEIGTAENNAMQQVTNQRADIGTQYQQQLTGAYGDIESQLRQNLYNERLRKAQEAEAMAQAQKQSRATGRSYANGNNEETYGFTDTPATTPSNINKSAEKYGVFSNGYQPKGIIGQGKLSKTGDQVRVGTKTQNIWKADNGTTWYWDGATRTYKPFQAKATKSTKKTTNKSNIKNTISKAATRTATSFIPGSDTVMTLGNLLYKTLSNK